MTELRQRMIDAMVQRDFAARTKKARVGAIRRMHSPSFATLSKYAEALGCRLEVRLVRKRRKARNLPGRSTDRASRAVDP